MVFIITVCRRTQRKALEFCTLGSGKEMPVSLLGQRGDFEAEAKLG
jgi:hypothetical protein